MDSSTWSSYAKMDPELEAMLPHLPPSKKFTDYPDIPTLRADFRAKLEQAVKAGIVQPPDFTGIATKNEIQIPTRDGDLLRAVHYRPEGAEAAPVYVNFHGGGWVVGWAESGEEIFYVLAKELGIVVVSVEYRKAPEKAFPTSHQDGWDAVQWVAANASTLGADPTKGFVVGGTSAGGNIATVVAHEAVDAKLSPPLTGVALSIPTLVHHDAVPEKYKPHYQSWEQNKNSMILGQAEMKWFYEQYKVDPSSEYISPLNWPSGHSKQLPTYFQVCGMDPLRDEALIYESILRLENGVPTKVDIYPGLPHAALNMLPMLSQTKKSLNDIKVGFEWLLSQVKSGEN